MKRSRHSRYDKKRSRDKKDDKRKFTFKTDSTQHREVPPREEKKERSQVSNKDERRRRTPEKRAPKPEYKNTTNPQTTSPTTEDSFTQTNTHPVDFEVFSKEDKKYKQRTTHRKKKSSFPKAALPIGVVILLFLIRMIANFGDSSSESIPDRYQPKYENRSSTSTSSYPKRKREKIDATYFFIGEGNRLREITQLTSDSIIKIVPNVEVRLFKGFHIYDSKRYPNSPILASYSKYRFFYDRVEKEKDISMSEQWSIMREKLAESVYNGYFIYQYPKEYKVDDLVVNETEFSISTKDNIVYGVATLVEYKNERHFFQFISKERDDKDPNYNYLRRYLNYYLKIKKGKSTPSDIES